MKIELSKIEINKINLAKNDVLAVKLIGNAFDIAEVKGVKEYFASVFPKNKVLIFTLPKENDIVFESIKQENSCQGCRDKCKECGEKNEN
jgi:hypothetical protein